ncbi:IclR family transcriptional regulator [Fusobacterium perfoetens]|uniref:IclR family transcriptional regulator n=1 Tax=Fusobacterium perfoetens TaxID=852 RepID=UPI000482B98F|nr:IclR family transcriptional regulator [Fusobacterium perfoetens]
MEKDSQYINSICRAIEVIELFSKLQVKYLGVSEISKHLGLHKTTTFRILKTLEYAGWIEQHQENSKYKLTTSILRASIGVRNNFDLKEIISTEMEKLSKKYNENIVLTTIIDKIGVWINMIKSTHVLSEDVESGYTVPLHIGATGKTLLAFKDDDFKNEFLEKNSLIIKETLGKKKLLEDIKIIYKNRFGISNSEVTEGVTAICVPILGAENELLYGLTISGPSTRFTEDILEKMKRDLLQISFHIENELKVFKNKV